MALKLDGSKQLDLSNPEVKIANERETRQKLINHARKHGFEKDLLQLLDKYDRLLKNCHNAKEKEDIAKLGAYEVFYLMGRGGNLAVNGKIVYEEK